MCHSPREDLSFLLLTESESPISTFICRNCTFLHFALTWSQLGFGSRGYWKETAQDLVLIKEAVFVLKPACRFSPAAFSSLSFSFSLPLSLNRSENSPPSCRWPTCLQHQRKRTGGVGENGRGVGRGENMWESAMINVLSEMEWVRERGSSEPGCCDVWCCWWEESK